MNERVCVCSCAEGMTMVSMTMMGCVSNACMNVSDTVLVLFVHHPGIRVGYHALTLPSLVSVSAGIEYLLRFDTDKVASHKTALRFANYLGLTNLFLCFVPRWYLVVDTFYIFRCPLQPCRALSSPHGAVPSRMRDQHSYYDGQLARFYTSCSVLLAADNEPIPSGL